MKLIKPDLTSLWTNICVNDDLRSFETLYHTLCARLIRFCTYYVGRKEIAEEIVSEVFVRCWENRKTNTHVLNPETYLFVAIKNQSLKHLRKTAGIHLENIEDTKAAAYRDDTDPERELERKELHVRLDQAIDTLPQQAGIVFRLIKENGMKYKEVAEILEISPRTVQTQLFRAIAKLRVILQSYHQPGSKQSSSQNIGLLLILTSIHYILFFCRQF